MCILYVILCHMGEKYSDHVESVFWYINFKFICSKAEIVVYHICQARETPKHVARTIFFSICLATSAVALSNPHLKIGVASLLLQALPSHLRGEVVSLRTYYYKNNFVFCTIVNIT